MNINSLTCWKRSKELKKLKEVNQQLVLAMEHANQGLLETLDKVADQNRQLQALTYICEIAIGIGASAVELRKAIKARDTEMATIYTQVLAYATEELVAEWREELRNVR